jgi:hypothetical protein
LRASPAQIRALPPAIQDDIIEAIARSVHTVFLAALPVAAMGFLVALLLKERPLLEGAAAAQVRAHRRRSHRGGDGGSRSGQVSRGAHPLRTAPGGG